MIKLKFLILGVVLIVAITAFVSFEQVRLQKEMEVNLTNINQQIAQLDSFRKVERTRNQNIEKVLAVINRYNPGMTEDLKYQIASEISDVSMKYERLDIDLICATITHESAYTWDPEVVSPVGAMGLMQIMPATGKFLAEIEGVKWSNSKNILFDPITNIRLGSRYLASLIEIYKIDGGLAAYNGGLKIAGKWLANNKADGILYKETQKYIPSVLSLYEEFRN